MTLSPNSQLLEESFAAAQKLAVDFEANLDHYLSPAYQESEVRKDFIDKFLIALGWDVNHDRQTNPYQQEVKVERGVSMAGAAQRRADYAFFTAPNFRDIRFVIEAKKPRGEIITPDNCFQTLRYAWNLQTPVAALTDFEQFVILDCRYKPNIETAAGKVLKKFTFRDYLDSAKFAEIYYLFSRDSAASGAIEDYAKTLPKRRAKAGQTAAQAGVCQSVDDAFLEDLDEYRGHLARAFKNKNPELDGETLTEITQRVIDRLVFIRFLEDKMIQPDYLLADFGKKKSAWEDFQSACRRLDGIYNGIVFKKHSTLDAPDFKADPAAFAQICKELSHVHSPYDFNAIPIHILGSIYERFLGNIITTTDKRAKVEAKPEVRKAGGVYYTPEYIVRYIVENTVGKLIEGKTPAQIAEMRFADIACGSGSFLLGVFDLLLRHHREYYNAHPAQAKKDGCLKGGDGAWRLSLGQRRAILINNIFGVDIDHQAVEVAQLSLYLKLLEEETTATARAYQLEFHETILPPLNNNIVCGNSLIGLDILDGHLFEPKEERKLNPMNFEDRFPEIMKRGGFDAIVGNPPWISLSGKFGNEFLPKTAQDYLLSKYCGNTYMPNMYEYFVARGLFLIRKSGHFGYIVPDRLGFNSQFIQLRSKILKEAQILSLCYKIPFPGITADTLVFILRKGTADLSHEVEISEYGHATLQKIQKEFCLHPECRFEYKIDAQQENISHRLQSMPNVKPLADIVSCTSGFGGKSHLITEFQENNVQIRTLKGDSIARYYMRKFYYFEFKKENITGRTTNKDKLGSHPKILIRKTGNTIVATFDDSGIFPEQSLYFLFESKIPADFKYLLGVINSKLMNWFFRKNCLTNEKSIAQVKTVDLVKLPVRTIDFTNLTDKTSHDRMVSLVDQMLASKQQCSKAKSQAEKDYYENKCASLDRQIDALVYELYGLTPEEIAIVEGAAT